jgi:hypothetical protein
LHENLSQPFHDRYNTSGLLYYAWVIPYGIAVFILAIFFLPVWWRMEKRIRFLFALSGAIYVIGAIGLEMVGGREFEKLGDQLSFKCSLIAALEESFELAGLILLIYTVLLMVSEKMDTVSISISRDR